MKYDFLVVGAGFAGAVVSERLANAGAKILLIDKRPHIGGNAYDYFNKDGILTHKYGPHIFHTNSKEVFDYLSQFTSWRFYEHRVLANVDKMLVPIPINRNSINALYNLSLSEEGVAEFFEGRREKIPTISTSEDVVVSQVGRELYLKFFHYYTFKQWGVFPSELDKSVTARLPVRVNSDDRYFTDKYQFMPLHGYTKLFKKMIDHPNIEIRLKTHFKKIEKDADYSHLIYTGPIDEYFDYCCGRLPYRSLKFEHRTLDQEWLQNVGVVNYPGNDTKYTRITEYKHLTGQTSNKTSVTYEYPCWGSEPFYPVPNAKNAQLYSKYEKLAQMSPKVIFLGRLGSYRYYNMDQVVAQALKIARGLIT